MMNRQNIFDKAVAGIVAQGKPATSADNMCMYRGPNDTRCAIGHCIPDDKYGEYLEQTVPAWDGPPDGEFAGPNRVAQVVGAETSEDCIFLSRLQFCHDNNSRKELPNFIDRFLAAAKVFAVFYELDDQVVWSADKEREEQNNVQN